jgi:hypothetical protein
MFDTGDTVKLICLDNINPTSNAFILEAKEYDWVEGGVDYSAKIPGNTGIIIGITKSNTKVLGCRIVLTEKSYSYSR